MVMSGENVGPYRKAESKDQNIRGQLFEGMLSPSLLWLMGFQKTSTQPKW